MTGQACLSGNLTLAGAIRDGRVEVRRDVTTDTAADFYRYSWLVDDRPASAAQVRALRLMESGGTVQVGGFGGLLGAVSVPVRMSGEETR